MSKLFFLLLIPTFLEAQSKKETIDWLNSKFPINAYVVGDFMPSSRRMKINYDGTFEIKSIDYAPQRLLETPATLNTTIIKGNFKDFSPSSVSILDSKKGMFMIRMNCIKGSCVFPKTTGEQGITYPTNCVFFGYFNIRDEDNIASRLKKAFIEAKEALERLSKR